MAQDYCHIHNLVDSSRADAERPWGIRVRVPATDPFNKLVGGDWEKLHWYRSERERDVAFERMREKHGYYRIGDNPSQVVEKIRREV